MWLTKNRPLRFTTTSTVKFFGTAGLVAVITLAAAPAAAKDAEPAAADGATREPAAAPAEGAAAGRHALSLAEVAQRHNTLVAQAVGPPQPVWLNVNEHELLALWQPDRSGQAKGAALILPAPGKQPLASALVAQLQSYLPLHGWATYALGLPELPATAPPPRPPAPEPAAAPAKPADTNQPAAAEAAVDETQVVYTEPENRAETGQMADAAPAKTDAAVLRADYDQLINAAIRQAIADLNSKGQYNIAVIGSGNGAIYALQFAAQSAAAQQPATSIEKKNRKAVVERTLRALVLVQLPPLAKVGDSLATIAALPTLDLYTNDRGPAQRAGEDRYYAARQAKHDIYLRRAEPAASINATPAATVKHIRGFLDKHAAGVEMQ